MRGMVHSIIIKICRIYYPTLEEQQDGELYARNMHKFMKFEYDRYSDLMLIYAA